MSINVLYSSSVETIINGVRKVDEEYIIKGDKGLKIKYYNVRGDKKEKIVITGKEAPYRIKTTVNGVLTDEPLTEKDFKKQLATTKLKFAAKYLK